MYIHLYKCTCIYTGGVKTAVDLVSSKHVTMTQIAGKWRMEQEGSHMYICIYI
jgi:hypothetical protein